MSKLLRCFLLLLNLWIPAVKGQGVRGLQNNPTRKKRRPVSKCDKKLAGARNRGGSGGGARCDDGGSPPAPTPPPAPTSPPATFAPTTSFVNPNPEPENPPQGYFNYDMNSRYGPPRWSEVDTSNHPLREFGPNGWEPWVGHLNYDPSDNQCAMQDRRQSPKDMTPNVVCDAYHEIRTKCGYFELSSEKYQRFILPHKLSLVMHRRPCIDMSNIGCKYVLPPIVDYPRYSSAGTAFSDLINYDIKIPGEHTIRGEAFDAEVQMLHMHPVDGRVSSIGIVIRATEGGFNEEFQKIINEFQNLYDKHLAECRQVEPPEPLPPNTARFDPYSFALMTSIFFYRYNGSITEPPCKDITWWIVSQPMIISLEQLAQIKILLFTHVDSNCNPTSVHNADQSVARPLYPVDGREIQDCSEGSYKSDEENGIGIARQCR